MNGRYNEKDYEDLQTLKALVESDRLVPRLFKLMRLLSRIRAQAPELWEKIEAFAKEHEDKTPGEVK